MTSFSLTCFAFSPKHTTFSLRNLFTGRPISCSMRKRRALKPSYARHPSKFETGTVAQHKNISRRPASLAIALTSVLAVVGLLATRSARREALRRSLWAALKSPADVFRDQPDAVPPAPVYSAKVVAEYNHDLDAFTQGLAWHGGNLYESTGLRGRSSLRHVDTETGEIIKTRNLKGTDFGEGLAVAGENGSKLVQLLWKTGKGYVYDRVGLTLETEIDYEGDGWGLASGPGTNGELFLSDGSSRIRVYRLDGSNFAKVREFTVRDGLKDVGLLNELEFVGEELWANIWLSGFVARIDCRSGLVKSWLDLREILDGSAIPEGHQVDVLNGIAYDGSNGRILVTGKLWPRLYSIEVTNNKTADSVDTAGNAFFLDPDRVRLVHQSVIGA